MSFTPNYQEYSLKELYIAKHNISKEQYPKKAEEIELAIFNKENGIVENTDTIDNSTVQKVESKGIKMKKQIKRLSPHQNGKVFGLLMAIGTLPMFIPMMLRMSVMPSNEANFPGFMLFIFPVLYLIFGYISVALMCLIYNLLQKFTGGFEYETIDVGSN